MLVIGFVRLTSLEEMRENLAAFHRDLDDAGYIEGRSVAIDTGEDKVETIDCRCCSPNLFAVRYPRSGWNLT